MVGQIFGGGILFSILGALAFVFWPADACQRINNATTLAHGALGLVPFTGEALFRRDMSRSWADVEDWSQWTHAQMTAYFGQPHCQADFDNVYGPRTDTREANDWLQEYDPELYKLLAPESDTATVDDENERGQP